MIVYNVTINIENPVADEWLSWLMQEHVPEMMSTGLFIENRVYRVLADEDSGGRTYAIQYLCSDMETYEKYRDNFAPKMQAKANERFANKFVAFRTLLESVK